MTREQWGAIWLGSFLYMAGVLICLRYLTEWIAKKWPVSFKYNPSWYISVSTILSIVWPLVLIGSGFMVLVNPAIESAYRQAEVTDKRPEDYK